ncbi:MAG: hypothetical protein NCW75_04275 [Phycisphaera sp.]|nr:MAG: hypothetical protein NCW75_04275 [Phycisphaera sp.]
MLVQSTAALVLATAVAAAQAQLDPSGLRITVDNETLLPGESTTIRLEAYFDSARDYCVGGIGTWLDSSTGGAGLSDVRLIGPLLGPGTTAGSPGEHGVRGILAGQINGLGDIYGDPSNPIAFWEATYTAPVDVAAPFDVMLETRTSLFYVYPYMYSPSTESRLDGFQDDTAMIRVIPAPAGAALLLGIAMACRCRRIEHA